MPRLLVPAEQLSGEIDERLALGQDLVARCSGDATELKQRQDEYYTWTAYNKTLLRRSFDQPEPADKYAWFGIGGSVDGPLHVQWQQLSDDVSDKMRRLQSVQGQLKLYDLHPDARAAVPKPRPTAHAGEEIFIVHGHDGATKTMVARFLAKLTGKEPVILHEQPDRGRTIIEKFEHHAAEAGCAVVLLTADDEGGAVGQPQKRRARQNVVLELGFFLGTLGRDKLVILYEPEVELPSDINGVLYIPLDPGGVWRNLVARELKAADVAVDLDVLLS
jgi:predicted nucleotide-binding protein